MRKFARHRHAWRIKEVRVAEPSGIYRHNGSELPVVDHRGHDPAVPWQVRPPRVMNRSVAGANARGPLRDGLRGMK